MDVADEFYAELLTDDNWEVTDNEEHLDDVDGAVVHGDDDNDDDNKDGNPSATEVEATNTGAFGNARPRKGVSAVAVSDVADQPQTAAGLPTNAEVASESGNASGQSESPGRNNYVTSSSIASRMHGIQAETEDDEFHQ
jgi:hypothetical protein